MKTYIIKDTITDTKTGEQNIYYTGTDGYVHSFPEYADGYKRKGMAERKIESDIQFIEQFFKSPRINNRSVMEHKWKHNYEIIEREIAE